MIRRYLVVEIAMDTLPDHPSTREVEGVLADTGMVAAEWAGRLEPVEFRAQVVRGPEAAALHRALRDLRIFPRGEEVAEEVIDR